VNGCPQTPRQFYEHPLLHEVTGGTLRPGGLALTDRALSQCDLPRDALVLDAGCGTGATVRHLRDSWQLEAVGLDLSGQLLQRGRLRHVPLVRGTLLQLPLRDKCCAAVLCECVLSLLARPEQALAEFHRVLAPGGYLLLSDVYLRNPVQLPREGRETIDSCLRGAVGWESLAATVAAAGFQVRYREDQTRKLVELAAMLAFAGISPQDGLKPGHGAENRGKTGKKWGYMLLVAAKPQGSSVGHE
jgi:arsenite methyltransferase